MFVLIEIGKPWLKMKEHGFGVVSWYLVGRESQAHDMHAWLSFYSNDRAKISSPFILPM